MTISETDRPHLWQLLQEIRYSDGFVLKYFEFSIGKFNKLLLKGDIESSVDRRRKGMRQIEELEAIKIIENHPVPETGWTFLIEILPKFDEVYKQYEKLFTEKEKNISQKSKSKKVASLNIPEDTGWEDIEIKFKNQYDVEIRVKATFFKNSNYEELGFFKSSTKDRIHDTQWEFLLHLSMYTDYSLVKPTVDTVANALKIKRINCMKIKEKLSKGLRDVFKITDEPFYNYEELDCYKTKFRLTPELTLRGDGEIYKIGARYEDNIGYADVEENY